MGRRPPASIPCPECGSDDTFLVRRNRPPIRTPNGAILRGHICRACGLRYISTQVAILESEIGNVA